MELLNKEQRNAGGYVPSRLPTMIVAQQHQMIGTISGQDTVQSNNGSLMVQKVVRGMMQYGIQITVRCLTSITKMEPMQG